LEGNKLEGLAVIDGSAYIDWVSSLVENRKSVAVSFVAGVLDRSRFVAYVKKDLGKISETSKVAFLPQDGSKILSAVLRTRLLERVPLEPFSNPVLSTNPVFAAENKEADAIVLSSVNLAMFSSQLRKAAFSPRAEITLPGFFGPVVVGLVSYLDKEPKTVASFIASLRTATRILLEDASGSIKTLRNQLKSDERTANEIYKSLVRAEPITSVRFNESYATSGVEFLLRLGLRPPIKAEDLIMTEPTRNIYKLLR
ncbi:MAG: hypothetical protein ACREX3_20440, partial [Gammaproteobacteria bacterium]